MTNIRERNNVSVRGAGPAIMFAHGFGCDQSIWRFVAPAFEAHHRTILFDHVGAGGSDIASYSREKYGTLEGYARDIVEIAREVKMTNGVFVGHSVSSMIGILAARQAPEIFKSLVFIAPSPSYVNNGSYVGGFTLEQIEDLLKALAWDHSGWATSMAPVIMANETRPGLGEELATYFKRTDPEIARHFARTTFLTDSRDILSSVTIPTLIMQCTDDIVAPTYVGEYMHAKIRKSKLVVMKATGHCPLLSAPAETIATIKAFL